MAWFGGSAQPPQEDPDRERVTRARAGDEDAFSELVQMYQHRVVSFARGLTSNPSDAEDVAQEAFLRAYRALAQFRGASTFKTWLFQIVTNVSRTHLERRRNRREDLAGDATESPEAFDHPVSRDDIEAGLVARDQIDRALATLPADLREALVLRDLEGLDYKEIAELLRIPIGTVESRIFRARQRLKAYVQS